MGWLRRSGVEEWERKEKGRDSLQGSVIPQMRRIKERQESKVVPDLSNYGVCVYLEYGIDTE